jgi:hypothetical protein
MLTMMMTLWALLEEKTLRQEMTQITLPKRTKKGDFSVVASRASKK